VLFCNPSRKTKPGIDFVILRRRNSENKTTKILQKEGTSKHPPIYPIFDVGCHMTRWNRGSLVEQHIFNNYFYSYRLGPP